jgi:hypothetical protein
MQHGNVQRSNSSEALVKPLTFSAVAGGIIYIVQGKGWQYQHIVWDMALFPALALLLWQTDILRKIRLITHINLHVQFRRGVRKGLAALIRKGSVGVLLVTVFVFLVLNLLLAALYWLVGHDDNKMVHNRAVVIAYSEQTDYLLPIDTSVLGYELALQTDRHLPPGYILAFPILFDYYDIYSQSPVESQLEPYPAFTQHYLDMIADRIVEYKPSLILIRDGRCFECPDGLSLHEFLRDTGYLDAVILPHYERIRASGDSHYSFYRRRTEMASSP